MSVRDRYLEQQSSLHYDSILSYGFSQHRSIDLTVGCFSGVLTVSVWLLSLPHLHIVPHVFGYTPPWMFAILLASAVLGLIASIHRRIWWVAVIGAVLSAALMLALNNS